MRFWFTLAAAALLSAGCTTPGMTSYDFSDHTWNTNKGKMAEDPVSHKLVEMRTAVKRTCYGETYYFESEDHAKAFDSNPYAFLYNDNPDLSDRPDRMDRR